MAVTEGQKIILGSGKLYVAEFTGTIPVDATIEAEANLLGKIVGGATLEYKPTFYKAQDDMQTVSKTVLTAEEASLKSGLMTINGDTFSKISPTARVTEAAGKRTVKIGGIANQDGKQYVIRFLHEDPSEGDIRLSIVGTNQAGFTLSFLKDKETAVDVEFKADPIDDEGTLIIYEEEIPVV